MIFFLEFKICHGTKLINSNYKIETNKYVSSKIESQRHNARNKKE